MSNASLATKKPHLLCLDPAFKHNWQVKILQDMLGRSLCQISEERCFSKGKKSCHVVSLEESGAASLDLRSLNQTSEDSRIPQQRASVIGKKHFGYLPWRSLGLLFGVWVPYSNFLLCFQPTNASVFLLNFPSSGNAAPCNLAAHLHWACKENTYISATKAVGKKCVLSYLSLL